MASVAHTPTSHRWHGAQHIAEWLLAVRTRLMGEHATTAPPQELALERTQTAHGLNAVKAQARYAVLRAFRSGCTSVAVLARSNEEVTLLRRYLAENKLSPWQIGGEDFE